MSNITNEETSNALGDDRDYFEEDFRGLVPGSWTELPEGYDVPAAVAIDPRFTAFFQRDLLGDIRSYDFSRAADGDIERVMSWATNLKPGSALEWPERAAVQLKGIASGFDFYALVGRKELDDDKTKETIADLQRAGVVTIIDGKTGTSIDAVAYEMAVRALDLGAKQPYEDPRGAVPPVDWAHAAARGIIRYLDHRFGIIDVLDDADIDDPAAEITKDLSDIVRAALIRRAA